MFPHKQKSALVKKGCVSFSRWWDRILMPMDYWSCTLAGDQTRGGKAPGLRATAANVATPNAVVTKGHRFDIYEVRQCKTKTG